MFGGTKTHVRVVRCVSCVCACVCVCVCVCACVGARIGQTSADTVLDLAAGSGAVTLLAGYYINRPKSTLLPTQSLRYLGLILDSAQGMFWVPADKKLSFLALVRSTLAQDGLPVATLQKLAEKAASMIKAVPAALLFSRSFHRALSTFDASDIPTRRALRHAWVPLNQDMVADLQQWLRLDSYLNGGPWLAPEHTAIRVETDASSRAWGGVVRAPHLPEPFECAAVFFPHELALSINVLEMIAVIRTLSALIHSHGASIVRGRRFDFYVDNISAQANFTRGGGRSPALTRLAQQLFHLQLRYQFSTSFRRWWSTVDNAAADALSRIPASDDIRLSVSAAGLLLHH